MDTPISCGPNETAVRLESVSRPGWGARLVQNWLAWHERMQQRRDLSGLSAHMLKDIGLTVADADMEVRKRPWQA